MVPAARVRAVIFEIFIWFLLRRGSARAHYYIKILCSGLGLSVGLTVARREGSDSSEVTQGSGPKRFRPKQTLPPLVRSPVTTLFEHGIVCPRRNSRVLMAGTAKIRLGGTPKPRGLVKL